MAGIKRAKPLRLVSPLVFDESKSEMYLFCLPEGGRRALLAMSDRLLWDAAWVDLSGRRVGLTEPQAEVMEQTIAELCEGVKMDEIIVALEEIARAINSKECGGDNMCNCGCGCNGGSNQQGNQQTVQEIYNSLNQEELDWLIDILCSVDEQPELDYKCMAANWLIDEWLGTNEEFREANDLGGITAGIIEAIITAKEWIIKGLSVYLAIVEWIVNYFTDSVATGYAAAIALNRQALVNAMYNATSPNESRSNAMQVFGASDANAVIKTYFSTFNYVATNWNLLYIDDGTIPADYPVTTPCETSEPVAPTGYLLVPLTVFPGGENNGMSITHGPADNELLFEWDNTANPFGPTGGIASAVWPPSPVGYVVQVVTFEKDANTTGAKLDVSGTSFNSLDLEFLTEVAPFEMRGRQSAESGLTDWVNEVPDALRDEDAQTFRVSSELRIANVNPNIVIGSLFARFYAVIVDA